MGAVHSRAFLDSRITAAGGVDAKVGADSVEDDAHVHDLVHIVAQYMKNPKSYVAEVDGMDEEMNLWSVRERAQIVVVNVTM